MDNENKNEAKLKEGRGLYSRLNMSLRTADIIITVLVMILAVVVIIALNMLNWHRVVLCLDNPMRFCLTT